MKLQTKVVLAQPIHPKGLELLKENVETVVVAPSDDPAVLVSLMDDKVEGVIVRYNVFNREMIEHAPNLKVIARHGIGVERLIPGRERNTPHARPYQSRLQHECLQQPLRL